MEQWLGVLGNLGVGGGLAFFFAWYLVKAVIPSLTRENAEQRAAFLGELKQQREAFLNALSGLKQSNEACASRVSHELSGLAGETRRIGELVAGLGERKRIPER